eukprot:CAMPEP_0116012484 /NCGR_PEP_ID=MMETSP0321-20121206/5152_1 /TAXON_ID=163516 /ORGANISM="Leptocylindrus danicus var. danicus, Strain B650" /LENGTH=311 /DNA_ID=CAMNT_0003481839 /DNA_START=259 /DNA_END=1194 /DNA_ORIENTATION=-
MNEGNDLVIARKEELHQAEVKSILADAASKINRLREQAQAAQREASNKNAHINQLKRKFEEEERNAKKEFDDSINKMSAAEQTLRREYIQKVTSMKNEMKSDQEKLQEIILAFENKLKELQIERSREREKAREEIECLTSNHTRKCNNLVEAHMNEMKKIQDENVNKVKFVQQMMSQERDESLAEAFARNEQNLNRLRRQLESEHESRLKESERVFEEQLASEKTKSLSQLAIAAKENDSARKTSERYQKMMKESENELTRVNQKFGHAKKSMEESLKATQEEIELLDNRAKAYLRQFQDSQTHIETLDEE